MNIDQNATTVSVTVILQGTLEPLRQNTSSENVESILVLVIKKMSIFAATASMRGSNLSCIELIYLSHNNFVHVSFP